MRAGSISPLTLKTLIAGCVGSVGWTCFHDLNKPAADLEPDATVSSGGAGNGAGEEPALNSQTNDSQDIGAEAPPMNGPLSMQGSAPTEGSPPSTLPVAPAGQATAADGAADERGQGDASVTTAPSDAETPDTLEDLPPQCQSEAALGPLELVFEEGFENYPLDDSPYSAPGSPWLQASIGREGVIATGGASHGQSLRLWSFLPSFEGQVPPTEVAYVRLDSLEAVREVVLELWYVPDPFVGRRDFAEIGLAFVASAVDLSPTVAFDVQDHALFLPATLGPPVAGTTVDGQVLYDELPYAEAAAAGTYLRFVFGICTGVVEVYAGPDSGSPPLRGTAAFDASAAFNAFYVAGGANQTYIDDIAIRVRE